MLTKRIIPCLDIKNGRTVKGVNFVNLIDAGDPVALAKEYAEIGADELVFLDISATLEGRKTMLEMVLKVAEQVNIPFTVGGGISSIEDVDALLKCGADKISINSSAVKRPKLVNELSQKFGSQCVVVAIDVNNENGHLHYYINGGRKRVDRDFYQWSNEVAERGAGEILLTAMHKDGTGSGFDTDLTKKVSQQVPVQVIASGGASNEKHFQQAFEQGADACLAAGMFHSGDYTVTQVKQYLLSNGIKVRL